MEKLSDYYELLNEGQQFLQNHNQVLDSLLLSKQNVDRQPHHSQPEAIGNEPVEPS